MFQTVIRFHLIRYPALQIQDIYKLCHQAASGSGHAVHNPEIARVWLERELNEMGAGIPEDILDPISPDGEIVRVHLRPYIANGGDSERLLSAFIRTANEYHGDIHTLEEYWQAAVTLARFPFGAMDEFIQSMKTQGYPAVHHSPEYEHLYRPAYRVVWQKYL